MKLSWDEAKRQRTLEHRGFDFADAGEVFSGVVSETIDDRVDYGEQRVITIGMLGGVAVVVVWTPREGGRRIISIRRASRDERRDYGMD